MIDTRSIGLVQETQCLWFTPQRLLHMVKMVDGAGSGLDADLLDGLSSAAFATSGHNHDAAYVNVSGDTMTGALNINSSLDVSDGVNFGSTLDVFSEIISGYGLDIINTFGTANVGWCGHNNYAAFSHYDMWGTGNYALMQGSTGQTYLNAASTKSINYRINNTDVMMMNATGLRVGSGTAPTVALDVTGAVLISSTLGVTGAATFAAGSGGSLLIATPGGTTGFMATNTKRMDFRWDDSKIHIIANTTSSAPATNQGITIENGGNVGIKNAAPTVALDVTGACLISSTLGVTGAATFNALATATISDAVTAAVTNVVLLDHKSSGTPAAAFGVGLRATLESSTTNDRDAGRLTWEWGVATDASREAEGKLSAYYTTTERVCFRWRANSTTTMLGFHNTAPVAKPAAYTQTYATATRTHNNITAVTPSAYAAGANGYSTGAKASEVHAAVVALITDIANIKQVLNQVVDDLQAYGLLA